MKQKDIDKMNYKQFQSALSYSLGTYHVRRTDMLMGKKKPEGSTITKDQSKLVSKVNRRVKMQQEQKKEIKKKVNSTVRTRG